MDETLPDWAQDDVPNGELPDWAKDDPAQSPTPATAAAVKEAETSSSSWIDRLGKELQRGLLPQNAPITQEQRTAHPLVTAVEDAARQMVPKSLGQAVQMVLPNQQDLEAFRPSNLMRTTKIGSPEYYKELAPHIVNSALLVAPWLAGKATGLSGKFVKIGTEDTIPGQIGTPEAGVQPEAPHVQEAPKPTGYVGPGTTAGDVTAAVDELGVPEANQQLAAPGEPPAPSMEQATEPAPAVREAISLDELRLMRERNDLQLQNDLAKRVTGSTHPAVDERLTQIDQELTDIANRELQPTTEEPNAIEPGNAQMEAGTATFGEQARPASDIPEPSSSDNVVGEAQREEARGNVPGQQPQPTGESVVSETQAAAQPVTSGVDVPVGAYGISRVSPRIAKFINDYGYGRSHLNQFLIDAYKSADKGDQAGVNKYLGFLRDDLRQMGVEDYKDHVEKIKDFFDYDYKPPPKITTVQTQPDIVSTVSTREAGQAPAAAQPVTGEPVNLIAHHGGAEVISKFDPSKTIGLEPSEGAIYFITDPQKANFYAKSAVKFGRGKNPVVTTANVSLSNPFVGPRESFKVLKEQGYDGWISPDGSEVAAFYPDQVGIIGSKKGQAWLQQGVSGVKTNTLLPYAEITPKDVTSFRENIQENGFREPLVFTYDAKSGKGLLTDGNHALAAANSLGSNEVPVILNKQYGKYETHPNKNAKQIAPPGSEIKSAEELARHLSSLSPKGTTEPLLVRDNATVAAAQPVTGGKAPESITAELPVTDAEPHVSAIANKFTQERATKGEIGEVVPGRGASTVDLVQQGLKMSPEEVNQHVSDVMQGKGDIVKQGQAVRAEEARLSQKSNQLSRVADANPNDVNAKIAADNAFKDLTDFHNGPVAKLKNKWHAAGMEMQGEIPVDLSTFNGLREKWLKDVGTEPPKSVEPTLRRTAEKVAKSVTEENGAMSKLGQEIDKATKGRKLPTSDDVRNNIRERMGLEPCKI